MTTFDTSDALIAPNRKPGFFVTLFETFEHHRRRRARQRALIQLSQFDAYMLRDIGIDPGDVADAMNRRSMSLLFYPIRPSDSR